MTRFLLLVVVGTAIVALLTRSPRAKRLLWGIFVVAAVYAVLKATGVIEALAP